MAITPLYTLDEINAEIAAWKRCHLALVGGKSYTIETGDETRTYTAQDIDTVWTTLQRLQSLRVQIESSSYGPQFLPGRPAR